MRVIVFDLDGTLLELSRPYEAVLADTFRAVDGTVNEEHIEAYNERFFELLRECEPDPYRRAFAAVSERPDELAAELRRREVAATEPPENAHDQLAALAEEYLLGMLTNGVRSWQLHKLESHGLDAHFDAVVTSYDAGAPKPSREPFALLEDRLPAEAYAMVGDTDSDVEGALAAGWTAYRYEGGGFGDLPEALTW